MTPFVLVMLIWAAPPDTQEFRELLLERLPSEDACAAEKSAMVDRWPDARSSIELFCLDAKYYPNAQ